MKKLSQITHFCGVKPLAWKSGCVKFLTNSMSECVSQVLSALEDSKWGWSILVVLLCYPCILMCKALLLMMRWKLEVLLWYKDVTKLEALLWYLYNYRGWLSTLHASPKAAVCSKIQSTRQGLSLSFPLAVHRVQQCLLHPNVQCTSSNRKPAS